MKTFDHIIIGSGQAANPLALKLAEKGTVALIEKSHFGGTCVNNGCTPTKIYVASARRMWEAQHSEELGIEIPEGAKVNMKKVKKIKDDFIDKARNELNDKFSSNKNITIIKGAAYFKSNYEVQVGEELYTAKKIFINVGGRAFVPEPYKKVPHYTNENIVDLDIIPEHLVVVGGSYIALEFAQIYKRFGSQVTVLVRGARILDREDENVAAAITEILKNESISIITNAKDIQLENGPNDSVNITVNDQQIVASHLLLAVGRRSNADTLGLENTDIELDKRNNIQVNDFGESSVSGIFALGDCNGKGAFTHTAYNDYKVVENYLFGDKSKKISDRITTYGLFIDPPLGRAGLSKQQAIKEGYNIKVASKEMKFIGRAKEKKETQGFVEAIIDADTDLFLGASVLGIGGDEIIGSFLNLMYAKQKYTIFQNSVHSHPTVMEHIPDIFDQIK